jgi:hypothetical protein
MSCEGLIAKVRNLRPVKSTPTKGKKMSCEGLIAKVRNLPPVKSTPTKGKKMSYKRQSIIIINKCFVPFVKLTVHLLELKLLLYCEIRTAFKKQNLFLVL